MREKARILVVDDHPVMRRGLKAVIDIEEDMTVCADVKNGTETLDAISRLSPDLAVMDISLPGGVNGIELTKTIRNLYPKLPVLIVSMHDEKLYAERALKAGASGYVQKDRGADTIPAAIRKVLAGGLYFSESISKTLLEQYMHRDRGKQPQPTLLEKLSDRELEIYEAYGRGTPRRQIASGLHITVQTVDTHLAGIKEKLGLKTTADVIRHAANWLQDR